MWPETTDTAPNSPIARALQSRTPESSAQRMLGSVTVRKAVQPLAPSRQRGFLLGVPELLHDRDQLARDEREGDEHRRQHHAGHGEDDLDARARRATVRTALRAEHQHEDQAGDHRRHRERQVDQGDQQRSCRGTSNLAIAQAAAMPNTALSGTVIAAMISVSRMAERALGIGDGGEIAREALRGRLPSHDRERRHEEQRRKRRA